MQQPPLLIYIPRVTNRHRYVIGLLQEQLGVQIDIISEMSDELAGHGGINYSHTAVKGWPTILPAGLLEQKGIAKIPVEVIAYGETPCLFPVKKESVLPYDPLSAIFYCVSRYEEYLPWKPDKHGRFSPQQSWQHKQGCIHLPVVEIWVGHLARVIQEHLSHSLLKRANYTFSLSMDVDHPFRIYSRPFFRKWGAVCRQSISRPRQTKQFFRATNDPVADPHNTVDDFCTLAHSKGVTPHVFFLLNSKGKHNSTTDHHNTAYRALVKHTAEKANVGIHTSYQAAMEPEMIYKEKVLLEQISGKPVQAARQHFLRYTIPGYYRYLLQADITRDYSMGYAAAPGFRAGTGRPFTWYDLEREEITELRVHPFAIMDATFTYYGKWKEDDIILKINKMQETCITNHSHLSILLHNDHLSGDKRFPDWKKIIKALKNVDK